MTATFENGLVPSIRLESIREDPPNTFQEARIRAKKHEANNLRGVSSTAPSTVSAVAYPKIPTAAKLGILKYCDHHRSQGRNCQAEVGGEAAR